LAPNPTTAPTDPLQPAESSDSDGGAFDGNNSDGGVSSVDNPSAAAATTAGDPVVQPAQPDAPTTASAANEALGIIGEPEVFATPLLAAIQAAEGGGGETADPAPAGGEEASVYTVNYSGTGPFEVRIDIPLEEYREMYLDGELWVRNVDYSVRSGSTVLTISEARLEAMEDGSHIIRADFVRRSVEIPFVLRKTASGEGSIALPAPIAAQSGEFPGPAIIIAIAAAILSAAIVGVRRLRVPRPAGGQSRQSQGKM
jgi:hypothetical protein